MQTKTVFWIALDVESGRIEQGADICDVIGNKHHIWITTSWWTKEFVLQDFTGQELVGEGEQYRVAFGRYYYQAATALLSYLEHYKKSAVERVKNVEEGFRAISEKMEKETTLIQEALEK